MNIRPEKPGDEEFAKQATDYANYVFMKDNPGYRIMWDATHDSLLQESLSGGRFMQSHDRHSPSGLHDVPTTAAPSSVPPVVFSKTQASVAVWQTRPASPHSNVAFSLVHAR